MIRFFNNLSGGECTNGFVDPVTGDKIPRNRIIRVLVDLFPTREHCFDKHTLRKNMLQYGNFKNPLTNDAFNKHQLINIYDQIRVPKSQTFNYGGLATNEKNAKLDKLWKKLIKSKIKELYYSGH